MSMTTDPQVLNAYTNQYTAVATNAYNQAKLNGDSDRLAFDKANAAMQQAMAQTSAFGWAAGGNWADLNSLAANRPPTGTPTLAAGQAMGSIGYIPGFTGVDAGQTMAQLAQSQSLAGNAAGYTGMYAAPRQSEYTPGTFVRLDPNTYDTSRYGDVQMSYVTPSGQMQRVTLPQARAMGWNGDLSTMNVVPAWRAQQLELAPPQNAPVQTLAGLAGYSSLNSEAIRQALAQAGATGMYTAPGQVLPPGTNAGGGKFQDIPAEQQQAYFYSNSGDWNAAMNAWVRDSNNAIQQAYTAAGGKGTAPGLGTPGTPQETMQAQQQYWQQAYDLASQYGQYYAPLAPGQTAQAGVNAPQAGQITLENWKAQQQATQNYLDLLSKLRGPADWAKYQQVLGATPGGTQDLVRAAAGQYIPGGGATTGVQPQGANLNTLYDQVTGANTSGMYGAGNTGQQQLQQMQGSLVAPNQLAPQTWNSLAPSQQQMLLGIWESQGYTQEDAKNLFQQSLPKYATSAPGTGSFRLQ
jgi:hypothetical protein